MIRAPRKKDHQYLIDRAREVLEIEAAAISGLVEKIDGQFAAAVEWIYGIGERKVKGRVLVSGIGKSGHIARKIASTLSSTGTPAYFVHPAEASHGDLGMIEEGDVFIAISYSGTSAELVEIVPLVKRKGAKLIAITGQPASALARSADFVLDARVRKEACPHNLAPTASTTAALALGDALAMALLDRRGFSAEDFARSHPRGQLHQQALVKVSHVMRKGRDVPSVELGTLGRKAVVEMSRGKLGMTAVLDKARRVRGILTDGDVRRALENDVPIAGSKVEKLMTRGPKTIRPEVLAVEAVRLMEDHKISQLLVVDARERLVGALNMHDLFRAKVI
jgi:arabinose-5-phosphate isomerase